MRGRGISVVSVVALVLLASLATVGFAGTAAGGDSATILEVEPETAETPPGETIHVAVVMTSDGGYGGIGVERVAFGVEYDSDVLTVEDVHHGPWMEQGNETTIVTDSDIDNGAGYARVEQYRDPVDGGATGHARIATLTLSVNDGADGTESPVNITAVESDLEGDWSMQSFTHNGSVIVDENATVVDAQVPETGNESGESSDDTVPGFGIGGALVAVLALLAGSTLRRA
ncbi:cohesin domain-containing protein [Natronorubrum halophilum]|uniref:cohesin domain-containing protein n=1 Tax=Natronorubrum halophilum TaxID=1702106 RepID=UPI00148509C9|nr:cohesin domain-containing protein [Natronorubrum halophilum]